MADLFEAYKPLRNHLRQVPIPDALGVIRAYVQHLVFGAPLPDDIETPPWFLQTTSWVEKQVYPWSLETLASEIILHGSEGSAPQTLRRWSYFAGALNKLRDLEGRVWVVHREELKPKVLLELHRVAHRQFFWQRKFDNAPFARYHRIFSHPQLDAIIRRVIGITTRELYTIGLAMSGAYVKYFAVTYPPHTDIPELRIEAVDSFLRHFAGTLLDVRQMILQHQQLNENYLYTFNPLRAYPLIRMPLDGRDSLVCPVPSLLLHRFTDGVYYEICDEPDFGDPFGKAYQSYIGEVLERAARGSSITVIQERSYHDGKRRKDTVDWVFDCPDAALFVECKAKRLRMDAKVEILDPAPLEKELDKLAEAVVQVYKSIADYRAGLHPDYPFDPARQVYPIVVTLDEWFAFGRVAQLLDERVTRALQQEGVDAAWLQEMPHVVCSAAEAEVLFQVVAALGPVKVLQSKLSDPEKRLWPMQSFLTQTFPEACQSAKALFPEDLEQFPG